MAVMKVIELMAESPKSFEDAVDNAVAKASESLKNVRSAYINEQSVVVKDGKVAAYRVNVKVTFEVE